MNSNPEPASDEPRPSVVNPPADAMSWSDEAPDEPIARRESEADCG